MVDQKKETKIEETKFTESLTKYESLDAKFIEYKKCLKNCVSLFNEKCYEDTCDGYSGLQNKTTTGKTCQAWDSQVPHQH